MKKIKGMSLVLLAILLCTTASASTIMEYSPISENIDSTLSKKVDESGKMLDTSVVAPFRFDIKDYSKKGPYTLEEESEECLQSGDSVASAKLYIASAITGNLDAQEYFQCEFGKSPEDLELLMNKSDLSKKFIEEVAENLLEEFKESETLDIRDATVPSGKTKITTMILKK